MSGSETVASDPGWYDLIDPATERVVGQVTRAGEVRSSDPAIAGRVQAAFRRQLLTEDGALAEELGVCFAGIETIAPGDAGHHDLVFRNLGVLTGLVPRLPEGSGEA